MKALRLFRARWDLIIGLLMTVFCVLIALFAPRLAPQPDPERVVYMRNVGTTQEIRARIPLPPNEKALLGTSPDQSDIYFTLIWGTRAALNFGLVVGLGAAVLGVTLGMISGLSGGWVNGLVMRITDGFITIPLIAGVVITNTLWDVVYSSLIGDQYGRMLYADSPLPAIPWLIKILLSPQMIFILFTWMPYARLTNALVLRLKTTDYVEAARALGAGRPRLVLRHLLPNSLSPVVVLLSRDIGGVVILQSALSFIGLAGGSPWGGLLAAGRGWIIGPGGNPFGAWWVFMPISLAIIFFGAAWSLLGDGLNDWLNPHTERLPV